MSQQNTDSQHITASQNEAEQQPAHENQDSQTNSPTQDIGTMSELIKQPPFRRLLGAWTVANIGDSALFLSIAIWIKSMTQNDVYTALIFVAIGAPALFAPVFGLLADRYSRVRLISISHAIVAAAICALFLVQDASQLWIVYAVTVAYSCTSYLNASAQSGLLKDTVETRFLAPANGIFTSIDYGFRIIVPLLAAGGFALWGIKPILVFTAVVFLLSAVLMQFLRITETKNDVVIDGSWFKTSLEGFPELKAHRALWTYLVAFAIIVATGGAINALVFPVLEQGLGLGPEMVSVFTSVQGITAIAAGAAGAAFMRKFSSNVLMVAALLGFSIAFVALAIPHIAAAVFAFAMLGFCMPIIGMIVMTIKQTEIPMELQGRSGAAMNVMLSLPQVLVSALVAVLLGATSYWVLILFGAVMSLAGIVPILRHAKTSS